MSVNHSTVIRAVTYYRNSDVQQDASIDEQREWAEGIAKKEGILVVKDFEDPDIPGSEIERRKGLMDMVTYCEGRPAGEEINIILLWDADRLSRADSIRTAAVIDRLMSAGVSRLRTPEGWTDFNNDMDRLMFNIRQDMTRAAYSKAISKNVSRSALTRARRGLWVAGKPPYGYAIGPDGRLVIGDEGEAETVRWIFREYVSTADSLGDLTRKLVVRGAPPPRCGHWTRPTVRLILLNRAYLGDIVWNTENRGKYSRVSGNEVRAQSRRRAGGQPNAAADWVVVENAHPALVDRDTFALANKKLPESQWKRTTPIQGGGEWALSGMLYCGGCGRRMSGVTKRYKKGEHRYVYRHYVCQTNHRKHPGICHLNQVTQDRVLQEVAALICTSFTDPGRVAELQARVQVLAEREATGAAAERQQLADRIDELHRLVDQGTERLLLLPKDLIDGASAKLRDWQRERDELARELARRDAAAEAGDRFTARVTDALGHLKQLEAILTTAPANEIRDALAGLVRRVTLNFEHGEPVGNGRARTSLASLEIELHPEVCHLLGTGTCRWRSTSPPPTCSARRRCPPCSPAAAAGSSTSPRSTAASPPSTPPPTSPASTAYSA
jgi:DNA invertase Pin-like site-specific DNA recombinase